MTTLGEATELLNAHIARATELLAKAHPAIKCSTSLSDGAKLELCLGEVFVTDGAAKTPVLNCSRARRIEAAHAWNALVEAAKSMEDATISDVLAGCDAIGLVTSRMARALDAEEAIMRARTSR